MKLRVLVAITVVAAAVVPGASGYSGISYASRSILCKTSDIYFSIGVLPQGGGVIDVETGGKVLVNATPQGAVVDAHLNGSTASAKWIDSRFCKKLRVRKKPKSVVPRPSYTGEGSYDCSTGGPVVAHVHYLRTAGRVTGTYVSVRSRKTDRFVMAGVAGVRGTRYFLGDTCVAR